MGNLIHSMNKKGLLQTISIYIQCSKTVSWLFLMTQTYHRSIPPVLTGHGAALPFTTFTAGTNYLLSVIQPASPSLYGSTQTFTLL